MKYTIGLFRTVQNNVSKLPTDGWYVLRMLNMHHFLFFKQRYLEVYHLLPNTSYEFRIWANNYLGAGEIAYTTATTLDKLSDESKSTKFHMFNSIYKNNIVYPQDSSKSSLETYRTSIPAFGCMPLVLA